MPVSAEVLHHTDAHGDNFESKEEVHLCNRIYANKIRVLEKQLRHNVICEHSTRIHNINIYMHEVLVVYCQYFMHVYYTVCVC